MTIGLILIAAAAARTLPTAVVADEHRLSAAEVERVLERAAQKREAPTVAQPIAVPTGDLPIRPIEGEVGVSIGTGGYREVFGTAVVPLGEQGTAVISFDSSRSNRGDRWRH
jgi:hypothetical protein